jgi:TonB-dependent starch-binding outer membrane protein SusC
MKKTEFEGTAFLKSGWKKVLMIMKLTIFLIFLGLTGVSASVYSQSKKLTLNVENETIREVFDLIESQSEFVFIYKKNVIDPARKVSLKVEELTIDKVLDKLFMNSDTKYEIVNRQIILTPDRSVKSKPVDIQSVLQLEQPQQKEITGKVTDDDGLPLPGVSVIVKGTTIGTVTNNDGEFSLSIPLNAETLQFSFVGMRTQEVVVGNQTTINVTMVVDAIGIEEVVAVGYGAVKKSDLTGAVVSISKDDLQRSTATSFDQVLQGRAAGVFVVENTGEPGGGINVQVRGNSSLSGNSQPLYVIDGIPIMGDEGTNPEDANVFSSAARNPLSSINPGDIISIDILKDASATAIYGSRGANGVVMIKTKRGEDGKNNIDVNYRTGFKQITKTIDILNGAQYAQAFNNRFRFFPSQRLFTLDQIDSLKTYYTDWQDEIYRIGQTHDVNMTVSGGTSKTRYAISGSYYNEKGIIKNSDFERFTTRINFDHDFSNRVRANSSFYLGRTYNNGIQSEGGGYTTDGPSYSATQLAPNFPVYEENGDFVIFKNPDYEFETIRKWTGKMDFENPLNSSINLINDTYNTRFLSNNSLRVELVEGLSAEASLGVNYNFTKRNQFASSKTRIGKSNNGRAQVSSVFFSKWITTETLTYEKVLGKHKILAVAGFEAELAKAESYSARNDDFYNDEIMFYDLSVGEAEKPVVNSRGYQEQLMSYFGRVNYIFSNRYLLTATLRRDGSSKFGLENKFGTFPSFAASWRISEESFMDNLAVISNLKLRAGYGVVGNQEIPRNQTLTRYGASKYTFDGNIRTGANLTDLGNPYLQWERQKQTNLGIDLGLFNNRISITAEAYKKNTDGLLQEANIPATTGDSRVFLNIGEVENQGFELSIFTQNTVGKLKWSTNINLSAEKSEVIQLSDADFEFRGNKTHITKEQPYILKVGEPLGAFFGFVSNGIWQSREEIDNANLAGVNYGQIGKWRYKDINGDGKITKDDRTVIGYAEPDFYGGITNNFSYKNFEFSIFIQGVYGNEIYNELLADLTFMNLRANQSAEVITESWLGKNTTNLYPRDNGSKFNKDPKSLYIEDGSYIRIRDVSFTYNVLPKTNLFRLAQVYFKINNLYTITNYKGYSPEVSFGGMNPGRDYSKYPKARTYTVGINLGF